jgi:ATP adenylyltransferase
MQKLWAPWRIDYIKNPKEEGCFFCKYSREKDDRKNLLIHRGKKAFILLNYYPYNNGHLMIAPYQHTAEIADLDDETKLEMMDSVNHCIKALRKQLKADGFNIGINIGQVAGAGIKDHIHIHVVPRWNGDTNFMPILGSTKVVSQGLEETWHLLRNYFKNIGDN